MHMHIRTMQATATVASVVIVLLFDDIKMCQALQMKRSTTVLNPRAGVCNHISSCDNVLHTEVFSPTHWSQLSFPMQTCRQCPDLRTYRSVASSDKETLSWTMYVPLCKFPRSNKFLLKTTLLISQHTKNTSCQTAEPLPMQKHRETSQMLQVW